MQFLERLLKNITIREKIELLLFLDNKNKGIPRLDIPSITINDINIPDFNIYASTFDDNLIKNYIKSVFSSRLSSNYLYYLKSNTILSDNSFYNCHLLNIIADVLKESNKYFISDNLELDAPNYIKYTTYDDYNNLDGNLVIEINELSEFVELVRHEHYLFIIKNEIDYDSFACEISHLVTSSTELYRKYKQDEITHEEYLKTYNRLYLDEEQLDKAVSKIITLCLDLEEDPNYSYDIEEIHNNISKVSPILLKNDNILPNLEVSNINIITDIDNFEYSEENDFTINELINVNNVDSTLEINDGDITFVIIENECDIDSIVNYLNNQDKPYILVLTNENILKDIHTTGVKCLVLYRLYNKDIINNLYNLTIDTTKFSSLTTNLLDSKDERFNFGYSASLLNLTFKDFKIYTNEASVVVKNSSEYGGSFVLQLVVENDKNTKILDIKHHNITAKNSDKIYFDIETSFILDNYNKIKIIYNDDKTVVDAEINKEIFNDFVVGNYKSCDDNFLTALNNKKNIRNPKHLVFPTLFTIITIILVLMLFFDLIPLPLDNDIKKITGLSVLGLMLIIDILCYSRYLKSKKNGYLSTFDIKKIENLRNITTTVNYEPSEYIAKAEIEEEAVEEVIEEKTEDVIKEVKITNAYDEKLLSSSKEISKVKLTLTEYRLKLIQISRNCGYKMTKDQANILISAIYSSKIVILKGLSTETKHALVNIINRLMCLSNNFTTVSSPDSLFYALDFFDDSGVSLSDFALTAMKAANDRVCLFVNFIDVLDNVVFENDFTNFIVSIDDQSKNVVKEISNDIKLSITPNNTTCLFVDTLDNLSAVFLTNSIIINLELEPCEKENEIVETTLIDYYDSLIQVKRIREEYYLSDDIWNKFDDLFVRLDKLDIKYNNVHLIPLIESFSSILYYLSADESRTLDLTLRSYVIPLLTYGNNLDVNKVKNIFKEVFNDKISAKSLGFLERTVNIDE